jgi:F-type H+-transporting ATPase subunit b
MEIFDQVFTVLALQEGIHLNSDILDTGLINIIILIGIVGTAGYDFLKTTLSERQEQIILAVQDAENRVTDANKRLIDAQNQLTQAEVIISEIRKETIQTKRTLLESDYKQAQEDLTIRFSRALSTLNFKEQQIFNEVKQEIISLTLKNVLLQVQKNIGSQQSRIIDNNIAKLGGKF